MSTRVGIVPLEGGWSLRDEYPLVRSRCNYNVVDVYTIAEITQDYHSNASVNRNVEYVFPMPPSAAVCSFKAVINDTKIIKGVVKEKSEAKKVFDQAVAKGKTAGLLQQEHADVFRVSLGNITPRTKISVYISFVSIVVHDGSSAQALRITLPTAVAPRYGNPPTDIPWFGTNVQNRFELAVSIQMNKPITSVSSPSHPIGLTLGCHQQEPTSDHDPSKAYVYLGTPTMLDDDIVIVVSAQGLDAPRCSVERWLESEGAEETTDAYALTLVPKFDLPPLPCQEYIFLVDRSGSMSGGRITAVKAALQILLRSLPSRNTSFNIVSFGSNHTSMWPSSQTYAASSMEEASRHVDAFDANYGGTELHSALEFAFNSRNDIRTGSAAGSERVPTSIFVLTDGEAWDLDRIIQSVTKNCEAVKDAANLLRTFVLGVGNQVSIAMCEGIARAGKGMAVYVAEQEKPDAKLISLLKAARGGVIEDLAVNWGDIEDLKDGEDDFEMVPASNTQMYPQPSSTSSLVLPPQEQNSLSLYDESHVEAPVETGPQEIKVVLGPPPVLQQSPQSGKLPIPLYPGFRCSIFAIIKQRKNPGPHNPTIKISGKVLGRDVALQVPVSPIAANPEVIDGRLEGGRLLHILAAKALIQGFEDLPTSPENKAQIERLGKRYSLASSVTSFVAISENDEDDLPVPQAEAKIQNSSASSGDHSSCASASQMDLLSEDEEEAEDSGVDRRMSAYAAHADAAEESDDDMGFGLWDDWDGDAEDVRPHHRLAPATFSAASPAYSLAPATSSPTSPRYSPVSPKYSLSSLDYDALSFGVALPPPPSTMLLPASTPAMVVDQKPRALTVASVARTQHFDGTFPSDQDHFSFIFGGDEALVTSAFQLPPLLSLANNETTENGNGAMKMTIWATILTLACLEKKFAGDKEAWELLADKAREVVLGLLVDILGLGESDAQGAIIKLETDALPLF